MTKQGENSQLKALKYFFITVGIAAALCVLAIKICPYLSSDLRAKPLAATSHASATNNNHLNMQTELRSPSGGKGVLVFRTEGTMKYFMTQCRGNKMFSEECFTCVEAMADNGTAVSIIKTKTGSRHIRILAGPHANKTGWVPAEMLR